MLHAARNTLLRIAPRTRTPPLPVKEPTPDLTYDHLPSCPYLQHLIVRSSNLTEPDVVQEISMIFELHKMLYPNGESPVKPSTSWERLSVIEYGLFSDLLYREERAWTQRFRRDDVYWDTVSNLKQLLEADAEAECSNWTPEEREIFREMLREHGREEVVRLRGARVSLGLMILLGLLVVSEAFV